MREPGNHARSPLRLRTDVVNWLLAFADIDDLPAVKPAADIGAIDRARYERRLGLVPGSLSLGRFSRDFADLDVPSIGERLLDEGFLGSMIRSPEASQVPDTIDEPPDRPGDPEERFGRLLTAIGLAAEEVLVLTGSPDVSWHFAQWGASAPEVRRQPGRPDLSRFGLAVIGRGQAGHKDFEPWTQLIKSYGKHLGPTMITTPSSNVSGILEYLWTQREPIRRYVDAWRSAWHS